MKYIKISSSSCVDMMRFRLRFDGLPGEGLDWFEEFCAFAKVKFDRPEEGISCVRYPRSLRIGTYREMLNIPVGKSSITVGFGRNGKGESSEMREGFLEFNPSKCYPSKELEYVYRLLTKESRLRLELVRWDFATDYELPRSSVTLLKDKRRYTFIESNGVTEYLGQRQKNGFVKLYDKQAELIHQGEECPTPRTRLEITIEEKPGKKIFTDDDGREILVNEWPCVAVVPSDVPKGEKGVYAMFLCNWIQGCNAEWLLSYLGRDTKTRYRKRIKESLGVFPCPGEYEDCRKDAFAWETAYGGLRGGDLNG